MTPEEEKILTEKALGSITNCLKIYRIDYLSLPSDLKKGILEVYIAGGKDFYESLKEFEQSEKEKIEKIKNLDDIPY